LALVLKAKILVLGLGLGLVAQVLGLGLGLVAQVLGLGLGLESGPWPWPWPWTRLRSVGRGVAIFCDNCHLLGVYCLAFFVVNCH